MGAINGGDGLTDIYGEYWLDYRLPEMKLAIELGMPFVILPQTIGPFLRTGYQLRGRVGKEPSSVYQVERLVVLHAAGSLPH